MAEERIRKKNQALVNHNCHNKSWLCWSQNYDLKNIYEEYVISHNLHTGKKIMLWLIIIMTKSRNNEIKKSIMR